MSDYYPKLDEKTLQALKTIRQLCRDYPKYLDNEKCPYPSSTKKLLREEIARKSNAVTGEDASIDGINDQIGMLLTQLKAITDNPEKGLTNAEKIAMIKAATPLYEKILSLRERADNIHNVTEFRNTIVEIMSEICTPEQRTHVMDRINDALSK